MTETPPDEHTAASRFTRRSLLKTATAASLGAAAVPLLTSEDAQASVSLSVGTFDFADQSHTYTTTISDVAVVLDVAYAYQASIQPEKITILLEAGDTLSNTRMIGFYEDQNSPPMSDTNTVEVRGSLQKADPWQQDEFNLGPDETQTTLDVALRVSLAVDGPNGALLSDVVTTERSLTIARPEDELSTFGVSGAFEVTEE